MTEDTTPKQPEVATAPAPDTKAPAKVVIAEDELKRLEEKVLAAKKPSEEDAYKKALETVRAELEQTRKESEERRAKEEQTALLAKLQTEIEALKNRPAAGARKGIAALPSQENESVFQKTADGRYAIPRSVLAEATMRTMFNKGG